MTNYEKYSEAIKRAVKKYKAKPENKEANRLAQKKYKQSEKGKQTQKRYMEKRSQAREIKDKTSPAT